LSEQGFKPIVEKNECNLFQEDKFMRIRRALSPLFIIAVAAVSICFVFALPAPAKGKDHHIKVMTRNMDAGTDFNLIAVASAEDFENALMETISEVVQSKIPERATRLAAEIAETKPDIIALQEVTTWKIPIESITIDQLDLLMKALSAAGQHYQVAAVQDLTRIKIPDVASFTDHNAILIRSDELNLLGSESHIFENNMFFPMPDGSNTPLLGGWLTVDIQAGDSRFKFVTTHLEGAIFGIPETFDLQLSQAMELVENLNKSKLPVILAGDFNSDAEHTNNNPSDMTSSYDHIAGSGFDDLWKELHPADPGLTWPLFGEDLMAGQTIQPFERIDLIFSNEMKADFIEKIGFIPGADGLYASDHAGLLAVFNLIKYPPDKSDFISELPLFH
jgi:endonuclease/exonuclease/phosphatase family metal-dependent hydrolase